jgi:hypothetical protein
MKTKILVTGGCSFSECINYDVHSNNDNKTWPIYLREQLPGVEHYSEAMGSQGNGLIVRRVQYRLHELLKAHRPEDILVGIMWTGRDRFEFYFEQPIQFTTNIDGWIENPTRVADDAPGGWVILNPHWKHDHNAAWYRHYYNEVASQIYTLEHVVALQNYLKLNNIDYFMTTNYTTTFSPHTKDNKNVSWLWEQVDWTKFLPVENEHDWVKANCPILGVNNFHPRPEQHEQFVNQIIMPWITERNYV